MATALVVRATEPGPAAEPDVVAVFPFAVHGGTADRGIGRMAGEMLSGALDGAGPVRTVDRHLVRAVLRKPGREVHPAAAGRAAQRLGAGRYVVGDVAPTGARLVLTATLYASSGGREDGVRIAQASIDCDLAGLPSAVDRLALQLLRSAYRSSAGTPVPAGELATDSLPAAKAFLTGEAHLDAGRHGPAVDAYRRAVAEDTAFALAYYRLSVAADWASRQDVFEWAIQRASALSGSLGQRERLLVRGLRAWRRGDAAEAEQVYRVLVAQYPQDAEAWYQLGETQIHLSPAYGRSVLDARRAFERTAALRPGHHQSLVHLQRLAAKAGDRNAVVAIAQQLHATVPSADLVPAVVLRAFAAGDSADRARAMELLRRSHDETVLHAAIKVAVYTEDLAAAQRIAGLLSDELRGDVYQLEGMRYAAFLEVARGRPQAADSLLRAVTRRFGAGASELRGVLTALPFMHRSWSGAFLAALADSLQRPTVSASPDAGESHPPGLASEYRPWAVGLLSVRRGDWRTAERAAAALARVPGPPSARARARELANGLLAEAARARGQRDSALALVMHDVEPLPTAGELGTVEGSRAHLRYLRAELLRELGRDEEALGWYDSLGDLSVPELIYLAPAELRQADIYERRGDRARAAAHLRRFIALWRDCEDDLAPVVRSAEHRLARLGTI